MLRRSILTYLAVPALPLLLATAPASAQSQSTDQAIDTVLGDHTQYKAAFTALQNAVRTRDKAAVAALVNYPFTATVAGKKLRIKAAAAFVKSYDAIVTPAIATVIEGQKYDALMVNQQGIMFGKGEVWINGICKNTDCSQFDPKVVTIQKGPN